MQKSCVCSVGGHSSNREKTQSSPIYKRAKGLEHNRNKRVRPAMAANLEPESAHPDRLETAADQAIAACGGSAREAVKALIVANEFLEAQGAELQAAVSNGFARGKFEPVPRDRKDWYD
jgi:stage V sporulation protein SpoVS